MRSLALHPFVIGQAFRAGYFARALEHIASRTGVWLTTSDEIVEVYATQIECAIKGAVPVRVTLVENTDVSTLAALSRAVLR